MPIPDFEDEGHVYRFAGRRLPSVTQVLSSERLLPSYEWLDPWYRDRGRAIHKAAALLLLGRLDRASLDPAIAPFVDNLERFLEHYRCRPLVVEQPLADPIYGFAGTPDAVLDSERLGIFVPDWKATAAEPGHALQVVAYADLLTLAADSDEIPISAAAVIHAKLAVVPLNRELPAPKWVADSPTERRQLLETFRSALIVGAWRRAHVKGDRHS